MGVNGLLPRLSSITTKVDLYSYQSFVSQKAEESAQRHKRRRSDGSTTPFISRTSNIPSDHSSEGLIRVGVDISTWVARACHGSGALLLDDRHLSNEGRCELLHEKNLQNKTTNPNSNPNQNFTSGSSHIRNTSYSRHERSPGKVQWTSRNDENQKTPSATDRKKEQIQNFINQTSNNVMIRLQFMQKWANILVVLDGASPPIKTKCVTSRRAEKAKAAAIRDEISAETMDDIMVRDPTITQDKVEEIIAQRNKDANLSKIKAANRAGADTSELYSAIIRHLLQMLREAQVPFLVAPYEADGQLAYIAKEGMIDLIVTEDSDLIGHNAPALLYKFNDVGVVAGAANENGMGGSQHRDPQIATGDLIRKCDLGATSPPFSLLNFTGVMMSCLLVCIGCDYCKSLNGIGPVNGRNVVQEAFDTMNTNTNDRGKNISNSKKNSAKKPVLRLLFDLLYSKAYGTYDKSSRETYERNFLSALIMFRHPIVFDPLRGRCIFANKGFPDEDLMAYEPYAQLLQDEGKLEEVAGELYADELAVQVAEGWINPKNWTLLNDKEDTPSIAIRVLEDRRKRCSS